MLVKAGGLGIRRAFSLTLPANLASATGTASLQDLILIRSVAIADKYYTLYRSNWSSAFNQSFSLDAMACKQHAWDEPIVKDNINHLFATAFQQDKSRLLAVTSSHSSDWLHALPIASYGLRLENEDVRVAVGLRLGARHASIIDIMYRACCRADIPAVKELTGLTRTDGKRPDSSILVL